MIKSLRLHQREVALQHRIKHFTHCERCASVRHAADLTAPNVRVMSTRSLEDLIKSLGGMSLDKDDVFKIPPRGRH